MATAFEAHASEPIIERVMSSDSFLSAELAKAPLREQHGSLIADISHLPNDLKIVIQGAREHNLKNADLEFPRNRMVVFTGLSGSPGVGGLSGSRAQWFVGGNRKTASARGH